MAYLSYLEKRLIEPDSDEKTMDASEVEGLEQVFANVKLKITPEEEDKSSNNYFHET